jgi:predicted nucleic acid-binding protein
VIVADTNLVTQLVLGGRSHDEARAVYGRDQHWSAPVLWRSEFTSVLAHYLRNGSLSLEGAEEHYRHAEDLLSGREYFVPPARVLRLLTTSPCSAYDCEFVALAQVLDSPLVTSDREVLDAFPGVAVTPERFLEGSG